MIVVPCQEKQGHRTANQAHKSIELANVSKNIAPSPNIYQSAQPYKLPVLSQAKLPSASITIEPRQLLARILNILLSLHAHIKDRAISRTTNDLAMQAALTALTLSPQAAEADLQIRDFSQSLLVEFGDTGPVIFADGAGALVLADKRLLAAHASLSLFGEFHEAAEGGGGDGDGARVFACEELGGLFLAEDGLEDAGEWVGELVFEVVFGVDGEVVFQHVDGVFGAFVVAGSCGAFDNHVGDAVAERWGRAFVPFFHSFC